MANKEKRKNYKKRTKVYKGLGSTTIGLTGVAAPLGYEMAINFSNFKNEIENFVVIQEETFKLNLAIAIPALVALLVMALVYRKKYAKALEGKVAFSLFIASVSLWMVYSVIEVALFTVMGAFVGASIDEMIFTPLARGAEIKAKEDKEIELEVRKERVRKRVRDETDGTV